MARPLEIDDNRRHGVLQVSFLLAVTLAVVGYLLIGGCQRQGPTRSVEAYCRQVGSLSALDQALGDLDPGAVNRALPALDELERAAPTEIEPQVKIISDTTHSLADAVKQAPSDDGKALDAVWRAKQADVARIQQAGKAVETYTAANCKVELTTSTTKPAR